MKRFKFCIECEHNTTNGCQNWNYPGDNPLKQLCPVVCFRGGAVCANCVHAFLSRSENTVFCLLDWRNYDCPNGIKNPLSKNFIKLYRNNLIF